MRCSRSEKLGSLKDRKKARNTPTRSRQKNETTASTVPACIAASKESPNRSWSNPKKYCARSKCPELEIGRNSVNPCTTPKNIASMSSSTPDVLRFFYKPAYYDRLTIVGQRSTRANGLFHTRLSL